MEYYESEQRKNDYDDVNNGKLNPEWPHWILSEDTIYDFYQEQKEFCLDMAKTAKKFAK